MGSKRTLPSTAAVSAVTTPAQNQLPNNQQQQQQQQQNLPLPDSRSMDWNSLVNTATKAINTGDETTIVDLESSEATASKSRKLPEKRDVVNLFFCNVRANGNQSSLNKSN